MTLNKCKPSLQHTKSSLSVSSSCFLTLGKMRLLFYFEELGWYSQMLIMKNSWNQLDSNSWHTNVINGVVTSRGISFASPANMWDPANYWCHLRDQQPKEAMSNPQVLRGHYFKHDCWITMMSTCAMSSGSSYTYTVNYFDFILKNMDHLVNFYVVYVTVTKKIRVVACIFHIMSIFP
jgi:hypothetical protein